MKLLCSSDWHIHNKSPSRFIIDRVEYQFQIVEQLLILAQDYDYLIIAGDIFEHFNESSSIINRLIELFEKYNIKNKLKIIYGNHDLEYNSMSNYKGSSLYTLMNHFKLDTKSDDMFYLENFRFKDDEPTEKYDDQPFVVIHAYHDNSDNLSYVSEGYSSKDLSKLFPTAKLVVSGDNHIRFKSKVKNIKFVNCGSLIPYNINDSIPEVFIYDTDTEELTKHKLKSPSKLFSDKLDVKFNTEQIEINSISSSDNPLSIDNEFRLEWKEYLKNHIRTKYPSDAEKILDDINLMQC